MELDSYCCANVPYPLMLCACSVCESDLRAQDQQRVQYSYLKMSWKGLLKVRDAEKESMYGYVFGVSGPGEPATLYSSQL